MDYIWLLWLITRLDEIKNFVGGFGSFCAIAMIVCVAVWFFASVVLPDINNGQTKEQENASKKSLNFIYLFITLMVLSQLVKALIPSKEDALYIAGGAAVIEAAQSDTAKRLASKSVKVVEDYLDKIGKEEKQNGNESK